MSITMFKYYPLMDTSFTWTSGKKEDVSYSKRHTQEDVDLRQTNFYVRTKMYIPESIYHLNKLLN